MVDTLYLDLLEHVLRYGKTRPDRTGIGTKSVFGYDMRIDLSKGYPLLTTKHVSFTDVIHELLWFLHGSDNIKPLIDSGVNIWNQDAYRFYQKLSDNAKIPEEDRYTFKQFVQTLKRSKGKSIPIVSGGEFEFPLGIVGKGYGLQWRAFGLNLHLENPLDYTTDQIAAVMRSLNENPYSRRHVVSAWNPNHLNQTALPPCHMLFQFYVDEVVIDSEKKKRLSLKFTMRSTDIFLGLPYNIASYAALTYMVAHVLGMEVGDLVVSLGDAHIYNNHIESVKEQLKRPIYDSPKLFVKKSVEDAPVEEQIFGIGLQHLRLIGYPEIPKIKAKLNTGLNT